MNSIPIEAVTIIDTPEYSAHWLDTTGEAWIAMKEQNAVIPESVTTHAIQTVWAANGDIRMLYLSGDIEQAALGRAIRTDDIDCYVSDFGTVDIARFNPAVAA